MNDEELLRKNNFLMSHGNLPCDTTTCETYGLSGNCGKDCPSFKSKTCDVYVDVLGRINEELQEENQKQKEAIDKAINWTKDYINQWDSEDDVISDMEILLNILKEVE